MKIFLIKQHRVFLIALLALLPGFSLLHAQSHPDFTGTWKLSNVRSQPNHTGDTTLHIVHKDPALVIETTIVRGSKIDHAIQHYTTDGHVSVSTGTDGDEFHTSIAWSGQALQFSIEEHEDGRIILSKETWSLIENGNTLMRVRAHIDGSQKQTLIYLRQPQ